MPSAQEESKVTCLEESRVDSNPTLLADLGVHPNFAVTDKAFDLGERGVFTDEVSASFALSLNFNEFLSSVL